jgi:hypothetical protein
LHAEKELFCCPQVILKKLLKRFEELFHGHLNLACEIYKVLFPWHTESGYIRHVEFTAYWSESHCISVSVLSSALICIYAMPKHLKLKNNVPVCLI